jgi:hypothetical protein
MQIGNTNELVRSECLQFRLKIDANQAQKHANDIHTVTNFAAPLPLEGDTLSLTYTVSLDYFGDVTNRLAALSRLMNDPDLLRQVNVDELNHGHSLFVHILQQIEEIQRKI